MIDPNDRSQEPGRNRMALARALPMLLFTIVTIAIIALIAFSNLGVWRGAAALYDSAALVCNGNGSPVAAPYTTSPGIHPVVAFQIPETGIIQANNELLRPEWVPTDPQTIELVVCTGEIRPALRSLCDNSSILNEVGGEIDVTLREALSGRILAEGTVASEAIAAGECVDAFPEERILAPETFPAEPVIAFIEEFVER